MKQLDRFLKSGCDIQSTAVTVLASLLTLPCGSAIAATIKPSSKSEWMYFNVYEPTTDCFLDDGSALQDRMATYDASPSYCDVQLQGWTTAWPNAEGLTGFNHRCPPASGVRTWFGYIHEESRSFKWGYTSLAQCGGNFSWSTDAIRRHFFYICPAGYELYEPVKDGNYTRYTPNIPACRSISTAKDPEKNLGRQCPIPMEGNPINVATGNKFQRETDYLGVGAFPLTVERFYNSQGAGWTANYQQRIEVVPINSEILSARVHRPDGRIISFDNQTGVWRADTDVIERLTSTGSSGSITGFELTVEEDQVESYDSGGRLLSVRNRAGVMHVIGYDANGKIATVTHSSGATLLVTLDSTDRIDTITDPAGEVYDYEYDPAGNLSSVTFPDGTAKHYLYNESAHTEGANLPNALTGIEDESSVRFATYKYNAQGRAISSEHGSGLDRVEVTYNVDGTSTVEDAQNGQRTYTFAIQYGVAKIGSLTGGACASCGNAASYTYLASGDWNVARDRRGVETRYFWNASRHLMTQKTENNTASLSQRRNTYYTWHPTFRLPTAVTVSNRTESYTHDSAGNVLTATTLDTTTSESRTFTYTYDSLGHVLTVDGPRTDVADVTTYTYYTCATGSECGQLNTVTDALGYTTIYNTYNAHGQPLTITDPNGVITTLTYDLRQRVLSRTVGSEQTTFVYWPTGLLKKATLPDGSFLEYTYDAARRLTAINDAEGNRILYTLDAMGNRTKEESFDPSSALTTTRSRVFNSLNQLWKELGAADTANVTTEFTYDNNGNLTGIAAPLGRNTAQTYDAFNRLIQITNAATGLTKYGYNALDQLILVTDPRNKSTTYSYNALGNLKQQVSPDTGTTGHTYDSAGNLKTRTDARSKTGTFSYDALNRLTQLSYPDQTIAYTYDQGSHAAGRLSTLTDASGSTAWGYDAQGRITSRVQGMGSVSKTVGYSYNSAGQLQALTLPSGSVISYGYQYGKVTSLTLNGSTTILNNVLYHPFGPTQGWSWGNATQAVREYDTDGKVTDIDSAGLKTYAYDDAFRITGIADADTPALSQTYGYDLLDRLTSATGTSLNKAWTYDANGNRLTEGGAQPSTYTMAAANNRIASISGSLSRSYSYDAAGNTTADGTATYTYDDAGRMVSATKAGVTATYKLNALGQRVAKTISAVSTYFVYDEAGHLLGEYGNSGDLIQETVWFGDTPVATLRPNGSGGVNLFYVHTDHLNTPRKVTRPSDNVIVWRWDSDPFGTAAADQNPSGVGVFAYPLRFPGQYYDAETGLHYNYFRDYDPATGRYVQSDPIGLAGGINTYAYVGGNPVSYIDPFGLNAIGAVDGVIIGGIGAAICAATPSCRNAASNVMNSIRDEMKERDRERTRDEQKERERDECEKECDAQWDRDVFQCELMWKMKGRQKGEFNACYTAARERHLKCYQDCKNKCK